MHFSLITSQNMDIKCLLSTLNALNYPEFTVWKHWNMAFINYQTMSQYQRDTFHFLWGGDVF